MKINNASNPTFDTAAVAADLTPPNPISAPRRRALVSAGATALTGLLGAAPARAQSAWPAKPVRIIIPFAAGGGGDVIGRVFAKVLSGNIGQPALIENRPGADGLIAAQEALKNPPDGHTIFLTSAAPFSYLPVTRRNLNFDPIADFTPLAHWATFTLFLMVHESVPGKTLAEVLAHVRTNPGKYSYGTANASGILSMATMLNAAGADMNHAPYKGEAPIVPDLATGRVHMMFASTTVMPQLMRDGKVRTMAALLPSRSPLAPDVPSMTEAGQPLPETAPWTGFVLPGKAAPELAERVAKELRTAMANPEFQEVAAKNGLFLRNDTPAAFGQFLKDQLAAWGKAVKIAKIPVEG